MRMNRTIAGIAVLFGLTVWCLDSLVDYLYFHDGTLAGSLLLDIPPQELYMRILMLLSFIVLGIIVDTYIQKQSLAHHRLFMDHAELDQIFNAVIDGLAVISTDFNIQRFNRTFAEMFEIDTRKAAPLSCRSLSCLPLCNTPQCPVRHIIEGTDRFVVNEFTVTRSDGVSRTCLMTASPLYSKNNTLLGVICNYRDMTDLRQSISSQINSEATLRTLLDAAPMGIGMVTNRIIGWTNDTFSELTGYSHEELNGMPARRLYASDEEYERIGREKHRDVVAHGTGTILTRLMRKDGSLFDVLLSSSSIIPHDLSAGLVFTVIDVTEQKKLEEQLLHSQKLESVGRLAGGIAHDFNNLLTVIYGVSQMARLSLDETDPLQEDLGIIEETTERASSLTRHLLAFSRHQMAEPRIIDLNDGLREMDVMLRRLIAENIKLTTRLHDNLWPVRIDPMQVEQVLTNLVINARDAMPEGGALTIETHNVCLGESYSDGHADIMPGDYVTLVVSDTGIGMNEETKERMFEPFYTTKKHTRGTGLGLSTCYGIVKQNSGVIMVYSEEGIGTMIKILLPRASGDATAFSLVSGRTDTPTGTETILLAEDDEKVRATISRVLRDNGYTVVETPDGETALDIAHEKPPGTFDLLITDIVMPNVGGRELAAVLAKADNNLRLLYISGYSERAIHERGIPDGGFLQKPFPPSTLLRKVRAILDGTDIAHHQ